MEIRNGNGYTKWELAYEVGVGIDIRGASKS